VDYSFLFVAAIIVFVVFAGYRFIARPVLRAILGLSDEDTERDEEQNGLFCNACRLWSKGSYCQQCGRKLEVVEASEEK
jgi:hypothetical protein